MPVASSARNIMHGYVQQDDSNIAQNNPVSGQYYTILDTTPFVRLIEFAAACVWTVQPTPVSIRITIDGQTIIHSRDNPVSGTNYLCHKYGGDGPLAQPLDSPQQAASRAFAYEGKSVKVEAKVTGGTVQTLYGRVKWAQKQIYQ